jgi:hypothetical protein
MVGFELLLIAFLAGMVVMAIIVFVFQQPRYPR